MNANFYPGDFYEFPVSDEDDGEPSGSHIVVQVASLWRFFTFFRLNIFIYNPKPALA